jgi:hypothetical protein
MLNNKADDFETSGNTVLGLEAIEHVGRSEILDYFIKVLPTNKHRKVQFSWEENLNTIRVISVTTSKQ